MSVNKKLGRPPDTSSEETRGRILEAARVCFAQYGFEATSNRQLAEAAELTTGAIYHYFGSKRELYVETHRQVQTLVYGRFAQAVEDVEPTFVAGVNAVLDEALALNREDPSLASFLVAVRTDSARDSDLGSDDRLEPSLRGEFWGELIDRGIETGELDAADRDVLIDVIAAVMMGLISASSDDPETHKRAIGGVKRLMLGNLIRRPDAG